MDADRRDRSVRRLESKMDGKVARHLDRDDMVVNTIKRSIA